MLAALLCLMHTAHAQTATWKGTNGTAWTDPLNWVEGVVPAAGSTVVIGACGGTNPGACPVLSSNVALTKLTINAGGVISLQNYTVTVTDNTQMSYATVTSAGGKIHSAKFDNVVFTNFNGPGPITIEKAGANAWTTSNLGGGNTFNVVTTIINAVDSYAFGVYGTFNEEVILYSNGGYGLGIGQSTFYKKVTINNNNLWHGTANVTNSVFWGEFILNSASSRGSQMGNTEFKGPVTINILTPAARSAYAQQQFIGAYAGPPCIFRGPVVVNNTSAQSEQYTSFFIHFGFMGGSCTFGPDATVTQGSQGYRRGRLIFERCTFQRTLPSSINLLSGTTPESHASTLILGTGTTFAGPVKARAPGLLLNGAVFNGDATFFKTGSSVDNSVGGNTFRKKLTITNQAGAASPMNLATQFDDLVTQQ